MELQAVMEKRRSIRNYNPERKVTKEQLEELIKAASYAPSWKNLQTSRYYCVLSENAVKELREKCLPEFNQANSEGAGAYIVTTFVKGMVGFDKNTGSPVNEAGDGWGYYDLGLQNDNLLLKAAEELNLKEDHERECKLATGGLPESIWETYSSFANTNGGTILLGIKEHRDSFTVEGLTEKQIIKYQKDFWSILNDRNKVSKNILLRSSYHSTQDSGRIRII